MLVKMHHETTGKTADVHPDEVANYRAGGYVVTEEEKPKRGRKPKSVNDGKA